MMKDFVTFARALDAFCARTNNGLAVVAIVLAVIVTGLTVIRAEQSMPVVTANVTTGYQGIVGP